MGTANQGTGLSNKYLGDPNKQPTELSGHQAGMRIGTVNSYASYSLFRGSKDQRSAPKMVKMENNFLFIKDAILKDFMKLLLGC